MSLDPGTRVGSYEVIAPLGTGGMGEVYRAADTNLKRHVAIKVLPEAVAQDTGRLARFQREAEVLAALNHANIAATPRSGRLRLGAGSSSPSQRNRVATPIQSGRLTANASPTFRRHTRGAPACSCVRPMARARSSG
jgi:serine/threonine protein kinase